MVKQKFQDDITIVLKAQKIITHETVRVNVAITASVDPDQPEDQFRKELQSTLKRFINTEWKIQSIERSKGTSRYENVHVRATARVAETENHQLQERAAAVSRLGFELTNPTADYSLTFDEIQNVNRELRLKLFTQAIEECAAFNKALTGSIKPMTFYRVSSSRFDVGDGSSFNNMTGATVQAMMASTAYTGKAMEADCATASPDETLDLNVSTRFAMTGTFTLRASNG